MSISNPPPSAPTLAQLWSALALRPDNTQTLNALGNGLVTAKRPEEAIPLFLHALRLLPADARLHSNLGLAYTDAGRFPDAEAALLHALDLETMSVTAHNNLACLYIMMGRHAEALSCLELALILDPRHIGARRNRALARLALGDLEQGWQDYALCAPNNQTSPDPFPRWTGQPLAGKRLLLTAREGLGDLLQFIRFVPQLQPLGAHITLECPIPLALILNHIPGIHQLILQGDPLPPADFSFPVVALAHHFKTTLATIPAPVPYLAASPEKIAACAARLAPAHPAKLRVGIYWQGNPNHQWDRFRSLPLMQFEPLTHIPHVQLISLQRGPGIEQIEPFQRFTHNSLLVPTTGDQSSPEDLADTAAIISLLDLIITVDTAPAHLAGALAKPVWLILSQAADWRWLTHRPDTPWYPTLRLYRQKTIHDWTHPFHQMATNLAAQTTQNP